MAIDQGLTGVGQVSNESNFPAFSWPSGKRGAVSLSFDDARMSQADIGLPLFDTHGVRVTFYTTSLNIEQRLAGWKQAAADGHEIGNHSVTHPCTGNYPDFRNNALENYTLEMMARELDGANAQIESLLGVKPRTFAYPCGLKFVGKGRNVKSYVPLVAERFLAGRGYLDEAANDPTICDLAQALGTPFDDLDFEKMKKLVDDAGQSGRWVIFVGHDIGSRAHQTTGVRELEALLEYLTKPDTAIWLDTVAAVASYIQTERDAEGKAPFH
jgi:peptidoglycan/xylan/chitin deacetylase (PgdA/CDA1 family)